MRHIRSTFTAMCAVCDQPAAKHGFVEHPDKKGWFLTASYGPMPYDQVYCYRMPEDIGFASWIDSYDREFTDYWQVDDHHTNVITDVSGPESLIVPMLLRAGAYVGDSYLDEHDYEQPTREWEKIDRWRDTTHQDFQRQYDYDKRKKQPLKEHVRSWVSTSVLGEPDGEVLLSKVTRTETYDTEFGTETKPVTRFFKDSYDTSNEVATEDRNAYVEGNEGFLSIQVLNEELTKKHHARILNVYFDKKTKQLRVGGCRVVKNADGTIQGVCVNDFCQGRSGALNPHTATREEMEQFVWALISHGNNHAAKFIREREDFYPLHHPGCDLSEDLRKSRGVCTHKSTPKDLQVLDEDDEVRFLLDHQRFCNDKRCQCSERLAELMPALSR